MLDVMYAKQPYTPFQRVVHIHPTVAGLVPTLLGALNPLARAGADVPPLQAGQPTAVRRAS